MCEECNKEHEEKEVKIKTCKTCGVEKPVSEFMKNGIKNGKQLYKCNCKICEWFKYHENLVIEKNWSKDEYKIIIDNLINNKVNCINDIVDLLQNKTLEDLISLLSKLQLKSMNVKLKYNCEYCNKEEYSPLAKYLMNKHHFCSKECYDKWQYTSIIVQCDYCGKDVIVKRNKLIKNEHIFCCHEHSILYQSEQAHETRHCQYCGKEFSCLQSLPQKFCSRECVDNWQRENPITGENSAVFTSKLIKCEWCGKDFYETLSKINNNQHHFCCRNCLDGWFKTIYSQTVEFKNRSRIVALNNLQKGLIPKTRTKPHNIIKKLLLEMNLKIQEEKSYDFYSVDLVINDMFLIEVMGTFWHCDLRKYNKINYNLQRTNISNDKGKHNFFKTQYNKEILYLWEEDISNNLELCKKLILEYMSNKRILKNYHSFNYNVSNNKLKLSESIIIPYMDWDCEEISKIVDISVKKQRSKKQEDKWIKFNCANCGKESEGRLIYYNNKQHHFCSIECHNKWQEENINTHKKVICNNCGKEILITDCNYNKNKSKIFYCNKECFNEYKNKNIKEVNCFYCGKEILVNNRRYNLNKSKEFYCSRECYLQEKENRITYNCEQCGKEKIVKLSVYNNSKHHFCSKKCEGEFKTKLKAFKII